MIILCWFDFYIIELSPPKEMYVVFKFLKVLKLTPKFPSYLLWTAGYEK